MYSLITVCEGNRCLICVRDNVKSIVKFNDHCSEYRMETNMIIEG